MHGQRAQAAVPTEQIMVSDGHPQEWIDGVPVRHLKLDSEHDDVGNTPRGLGALMAIAERYDAITFLDADNWWEPNPTVNALARGMGSVSHGLGVLGTGLALNDIAHAENPARATVANAGAIAGGWLGGAGGAAIPVVSPATAIVGSLVGGDLGYRIGGGLYDMFSGVGYDNDMRDVRRFGR